MNTNVKTSDKAKLLADIVRSSGNNAKDFCKKVAEFLNVPDLSEETYGEKWKDCGEHIRPDTFWCMAFRGEEKNPFDKFNFSDVESVWYNPNYMLVVFQFSDKKRYCLASNVISGHGMKRVFDLLKTSKESE